MKRSAPLLLNVCLETLFELHIAQYMSPKKKKSNAGANKFVITTEIRCHFLILSGESLSYSNGCSSCASPFGMFIAFFSLLRWLDIAELSREHMMIRGQIG